MHDSKCGGPRVKVLMVTYGPWKLEIVGSTPAYPTMKFSIITPWLPPRKTIHNTIRYIDEQTYGDWEHLIAIDRKDHEPLESSDPRRRIFECDPEHRNWGNRCRYEMWEKATGEWIIYLDDDDILYPNALDRVARWAIGNTSHDWGYFAIKLGNGKFFHYPPQGGLITGGQVFHRRIGLDGTPIRWFDTPNMAADWDLVYQQLIPRGDPILIDEILGQLPKHGKGQV